MIYPGKLLAVFCMQRQQVSSKGTRLHAIIFQEAVIFILIIRIALVRYLQIL
jgi:hypothetical protein